MKKAMTQSSWLRALCVVVAITLPLTLALRGAWTLSMSAINQQLGETERVKTQEIRSESRSLSDEISSEIENIQLRALATYLLGKFEPGIANSALHAVAVLTPPSAASQALVKYYEVANVISDTPGPLGPVETQDLANAVHSIVLKDIQTSGVSIVSLNSGNSWSSWKTPVAFKDASGNALVGLAFSAPNGKILMAVVDPVQAFAGVGKWAMGREGEMLRGYVVGQNGRVLIHSEKAYNGSDFSSNALYRQALQPALRGERVGGTGVFAAVDTLKARVSYSQLRSLPFVVVAERVVRGNSTAMYKRLLGPALTMTGILVLACLVSIVLLIRIFTPKTANVVQVAAANPVEAQVVESAVRKFDDELDGDNDEFDEMLDDMIATPQPTRQIQVPVEIAAIDRTKITSQVQPVKKNELPS